jgi:hypothetical protein
MPKAAKQNITTRNTARSKADPSLAAIEHHQRLDRAYLDLCAALDRAGLLDVRQYDVDRAIDAEQSAAWKMARTKPTTAAGASAMLTYIAVRPISGLFELGETRWHETAFRTCTKALARITGRQSRSAA